MKGAGSVYQRNSDGRWVGKYCLPPDPVTGKKMPPKYVYSSKPGRKGEQEVKRKLQELIDKIDSGDMSDIYKITVKGWLDRYIKNYCSHLEKTTLDGYQRYINKHINPIIGHLKLCDLKPIQIQYFYNKERELKYSEKTILQEHRILHRAFKKAVADGMMSKNPCDGVDAPSPDDYEPYIYTEREFINLLECLDGNRMESIILIAGMCGLRRGELLGLTWEDIDLNKGTLTVSKNVVPTSEGVIEKGPKTKKSARTISIPSSIIPILKKNRGIGKLYTKLNGENYNPGSVSRYFKDFLEQNGLPHIRLHDLRHFNGTMMLKNGVSDRETQERLGHSNSEMTKKYQHILKEMDKKSANKLNKVLKPKKNKTGVKTGVKT